MPESAPVSPKSRRVLIVGGLLVAVAAGGLAAYFASDSRAKEQRKSPKGPPAVPVTSSGSCSERRYPKGVSETAPAPFIRSAISSRAQSRDR